MPQRSPLDDVLSQREVARLIGTTYASLRQRRTEGRFIDPDGEFDGRPWWYESTIRAWLRERTS